MKNYVLFQADHEDTEVVNFNRMMLPTYYGLLKMCCIESRIFRRQLAQHQNIQWAFKNITPYYTQYTMACEELFKLMALFVKPFKKTEGNSLQPSYLKLASKFHYFSLQEVFSFQSYSIYDSFLWSMKSLQNVQSIDRLIPQKQQWLNIFNSWLAMIHASNYFF